LAALVLGFAFASGCGGATPRDAASDAPGETPSDAPMACLPIATYCATNHCVSDWSDAAKPSSWCTTDAGAPYELGYADVLIEPDCSGFNVVVLSATDTSIFYFYDVATGKLAGVGRNGLQSCLAGTLPAASLSFACIDGGISENNVCGR
jgi:hypothetical protein